MEGSSSRLQGVCVGEKQGKGLVRKCVA
jgi:hypothetical protein